jgi:CDP-2,3-bis-(O-geranylgeranyl)-sn-glycerol synthase
MHIWLLVQLLALLSLANGTPIAIHRIFGRRFSFPIDAGATFLDGQPLLGPSKTVRGLLLSILITAAAAPLLGLDWKVGVVMGSGAMAGDLFSSFIKRRMRLVASSQATGLDQIPESLFPLLMCRQMLSLTFAEIVLTVAVFFVGEVFLSIIFYKLHLRERPY